MRDIMEEYAINPQRSFKFKPRILLSNCNFTSVSIIRTQRLQKQCTLQIKNTTTNTYSNVASLIDCTIPNGMMVAGNYYRVEIVGYDPMKEYPLNATKYSIIKLTKTPVSSFIYVFDSLYLQIIAKIIGADQRIDSNYDLTLAVRGENLDEDLQYSWACKDPVTGLQCVDLYGKYLFLQGQESVFIKRNILSLNTPYEISFNAAD